LLLHGCGAGGRRRRSGARLHDYAVPARELDYSRLYFAVHVFFLGATAMYIYGLLLGCALVLEYLSCSAGLGHILREFKVQSPPQM
jgi:hypothetical protein